MKNDPLQETAPATPAAGRAGAPPHAHALNAVTPELNAATALRTFDGGQWATVLAIHNRFRGKDRPAKPIPISVKFSDHTVAFARTAIRKGVHFTVTGSLDHDVGEKGREFYRINVDQLRAHPRKPAEPAR